MAPGTWDYSALAQTPLSNLVVTVGTTIRDGAGRDWSYVLIGAPDARLLAGRRFAVYGKAGYPTSAGTFTPRGTMAQQTDPAAINTLLAQSVSLGQNLTSLDNALARAVRSNLVVGLLRDVPGITNLSLPQKILIAFAKAAAEPATAQVLALMGNAHPGLQLCNGRAFAEPITTTTTYEVRELNPAGGAAGDVVGRVTIVPNAPVILPAPGRPFQVMTNAPSDHLLIRLRWGTPPELRRLAPLQFGFNVWRIHRLAAEAGGFDVTPPTPAQLRSNPDFIRANTATAVMATKDFEPGGEADPTDTTTYFFADNGRPTLHTNFNAGDEFYYFITARDLLGRDGLASPGGLAVACRRIPPAAPDDVRVENAILPGSTNQPRLRVLWTQNTNAADAVDEYWVYRWINPAGALTNDASPSSNRIAIVAQIPGTDANSFLDSTPGALTNANATNVWYTLRAVVTNACDPLLSPQSPPAWGVLRERRAPDATTGEIVGSCGSPVVMFQNFATNTIPADAQIWNFRLTCVRRDRGIAWAQFYVTNIASVVSTQVDTIGPVYFPPDGDVAQLDYPVAADDNYGHVFNLGCVVGTDYGQFSATANASLTAPFPSAEQHEVVFYAGQLLATALNSGDPLLLALNNGNPRCYPAFNVAADASGMVSMQFDVAPGTPLLVQALTNGNWGDVALVTGDSNGVYWVPYPACLVGPLPQFQGCVARLPAEPGCDQHVTRAAAGGPVAPLRIRFRLTRRTHEYRVYRRVDDGPLTLLAAGAAVYDPANPGKILETRDEAMPVVPAQLCYFVQTLDENGNGSPLAFIGCAQAHPADVPRPVLSDPKPAGTSLNPQVLLNWFCPTGGVARFEVKVKRLDPELPAAPSGISSPQLSPNPAFNKKALYLGLNTRLLSAALRMMSFDEGWLTPPISAGFGPGPQFTLTVNVRANAHYAVSVSSVDARGAVHEATLAETKTFLWTAPYEPAEVPWPARPLPPVTDFDAVGPGDTPPPFSPRVAAEVFYDSDGVAPNPRYPVGVRIGQLDANGHPNDNALTDHTDEYLNYQSGGLNSGGTPADPNSGIYRSRGTSRVGQSLLPMVLYRQQVTNRLFPRVSGAVVQVSPLIERIPWTINPNLQVTVPDRLFAGYTAYDPVRQSYVYLLYLRDLQPVQLGARYRYFVVRFNDKREVRDIILAGEVELPFP